MSLFRPFTRKRAFRLVVRVGVIAALIVAMWCMFGMPGKSFRGPLPPLSVGEIALQKELTADVQKLAGEIGERNVQRYAQLTAAALFIEQSFAASGLKSRRDTYEVNGRSCDNLEVELPGTRFSEIVIVGAHYDSVSGAPGANDNASGVAAVLALARHFARAPGDRTLRLVAFVNEEPVHFQTEQMGSWVYASRCKARGDKIVAMLSLETIGCFSNIAGSQHYPLPILKLIYPSVGNFVAFVGNLSSRRLVKRTIRSFREHAQFPSEGAALPSQVPGISWSDHWAFWQHGYPAIMITDTAPFRYPHYHLGTDTPDKLDYDSLARVVGALQAVVEDLINRLGAA